MLVLTRRNDEKIVFPSLGVTVHVLRIRGNIVKIGVDAPSDVPVLRHEVADDRGRAPVSTLDAQVYTRELKHLLLNRLNAATLAIHGSQQLSAVGRTEDAESTLQAALDKLMHLSQELDTVLPKVGPALQSQMKSPAPAAPLENQSGRCQTLLVEDDRNESELLAGYLRLSGISVATADDGEQALNYLATHESPEFVLLDMQMPRMDGRQTIERIRHDPKLRDLRVLAISGTCPEDMGVKIGPEGIDRWFGKPLNPTGLVEMLKRDMAI